MASNSIRCGWIVRTGDDYLFPKDGDVGYTPDMAEVGTF